MTDILSKWATYRKTTHTDYEADTLGDEMAKEIERLLEDRDFIDAISSEYWDVKCFDIPTGQGDADIGWVVVSHHMGKPCERKEAEVWHDDLRAVMRQAIQSK